MFSSKPVEQRDRQSEGTAASHALRSFVLPQRDAPRSSAIRPPGQRRWAGYLEGLGGVLPGSNFDPLDEESQGDVVTILRGGRIKKSLGEYQNVTDSSRSRSRQGRSGDPSRLPGPPERAQTERGGACLWHKPPGKPSFKKTPPQQNSWANSGSGRAPSR